MVFSCYFKCIFHLAPPREYSDGGRSSCFCFGGLPSTSDVGRCHKVQHYPWTQKWGAHFTFHYQSWRNVKKSFMWHIFWTSYRSWWPERYNATPIQAEWGNYEKKFTKVASSEEDGAYCMSCRNVTDAIFKQSTLFMTWAFLNGSLVWYE